METKENETHITPSISSAVNVTPKEQSKKLRTHPKITKAPSQIYIFHQVINYSHLIYSEHSSQML